MATLLITGASGLLGSTLAAHAAAAGWDVVGTHLTRRPDGLARAEVLDVRDGEAVAALVDRVAPDAIVHTAYRQDDTSGAINRDGAEHVARAAVARGARLVHLSSDVVFGGELARPLREDDPVGPVTAYGATKVAAETAVARADPGALLVRTSLLYAGPPHPPSAHEAMALAAATGEREVSFFTDEVRCPIQAGDLAAALLELVATRRAGVLHVAGADALDRLAFARLVVAARGLDPAVLRGGPRPPGRPGVLILDSSVAQQLVTTRLRGAREVLGG